MIAEMVSDGGAVASGAWDHAAYIGGVVATCFLGLLTYLGAKTRKENQHQHADVSALVVALDAKMDTSLGNQAVLGHRLDDVEEVLVKAVVPSMAPEVRSTLPVKWAVGEMIAI